MQTLREILAVSHGVATLAQLEAGGLSAHRRARAIARGEMIRVRNGWFAAPDATPELIRAVRIGGRLTCTSALAVHGVWTMPDSRLHVALARGACRLRSPDDQHSELAHDDPALALHWRHYETGTFTALDSVASAIAHLIRCADQDSAIVAIDSALNRGLLTQDRLTEVLADAPGKYRRIGELVDDCAESGLETLARLRLRRHGIRVATQVQIVEVGRVDVLVGDRLILELDGREHHLGEQFERDRGRDLRATGRGYLPLRVSYRQVLYEWHAIEQAILQLVRRGEHEWRGMHHRLGLAAPRPLTRGNSGTSHGARSVRPRPHSVS